MNTSPSDSSTPLDPRVSQLLEPSCGYIGTRLTKPFSKLILTPISTWGVSEWIEPWDQVGEKHAGVIADRLRALAYPPEMVKLFLAEQERARIRDLTWHDALWLLSLARLHRDSKPQPPPKI